MKAELTHARLLEVLHYDPETGVFTWRVSTRGHAVGQTAGCVSKTNRHRVIGIDRVTYRAARLAWLYVFGRWPLDVVDHVNGVRSDDRLSNLRDVSAAVNAQNRRHPRRGARSGLLGVSFDPRDSQRRPWRVQIWVGGVGGRNLKLGRFADPQIAHQVYLEAKRRLHPGCTI